MRLKLPQCPWMYLLTVCVELSPMHETILRVDIVATNVTWESAKGVGNFKSLKHLLQVNHPLIGELWEHGLVEVFICPRIRFVSLCLRCRG